jgi:hypothetical protein
MEMLAQCTIFHSNFHVCSSIVPLLQLPEGDACATHILHRLVTKYICMLRTG